MRKPNSRSWCYPTNGQVFRVAVTSGASTGVYEALELRGKDAKRFNWKGCLKTVNNVNIIIYSLIKGY